MIHYFRNPKTEDLIIFDSKENEILILERIKRIQVFTEEDLKQPIKDFDIYKKTESEWEDEPAVKKDKKRRHKITDEMVERMRQMKGEGLNASKIAKTLGVSYVSVIKKLKE